ncbi:MAG: choice-of-anchor Q domain-containing protein [Syntrophobacter sp.]
MKRIFLLIAVLPLLVAAQCPAATYYVATTGNDSHTTEQARHPETPWLTLNHAESSATHGDVVQVATGTYVEDHPSEHSLYTTKRINWIADGIVIIQANASGTKAIRIGAAASGQSFTGFTFDSQGTKAYTLSADEYTVGTTFSNCVFKDATTWTVVGNTTSTAWSFSECTFSSTQTSGIWSGVIGGVSIIRNTFSYPNHANQNAFQWSTSPSQMVTMSDNTLSINIPSTNAVFRMAAGSYSIHNNNFIITGSPTYLLSTTGAGAGILTFSGNTISSGVPFLGTVVCLNTWTCNAQIQNNNISIISPLFSGQYVLLLKDQANPVISGNTINVYGSGINCIRVYSTGTDCGTVRVTNNTISTRSNAGSCIYVGQDTSTSDAGDGKLNGAIITGNRIYGPVYFDNSLTGATNHGILYGQNINGVIQGNYVNGAGYGLVVKGTPSTWTAGRVANNVFVNCAGTGTSLIRIKGARNVPIYNNVAYIASGLAGADKVFDISINGTDQSATGTILKNNIAVGVTNPVLSVDAASVSGLVADNNIWYRPAGSPTFSVSGSTQSWAQWQSAGYDTHGINTDPEFLDPVNGDYRLSRSSPAINAGTDVGLTTDIRGWPVPLHGIPDIGAYEFWEQSPVIAQ